jgi:hypothetical protein
MADANENQLLEFGNRPFEGSITTHSCLHGARLLFHGAWSSEGANATARGHPG